MIAPVRSVASAARSCEEGEYRRDQHSAGLWPGFREFSLRCVRKKRSRRSLSIATRREGGVDCARTRRAVLAGGQGSSRGGASGCPSSWSDPLDAGRTRHAASQLARRKVRQCNRRLTAMARRLAVPQGEGYFEIVQPSAVRLMAAFSPCWSINTRSASIRRLRCRSLARWPLGLTHQTPIGLPQSGQPTARTGWT
ncbi:hypothetical protein Brsp07_05450 [Brucella sp. NBRC 14130]